jgi:hypothetical protein
VSRPEGEPGRECAGLASALAVALVQPRDGARHPPLPRLRLRSLLAAVHEPSLLLYDRLAKKRCASASEASARGEVGRRRHLPRRGIELQVDVEPVAGSDAGSSADLGAVTPPGSGRSARRHCCGTSDR